MTQRAAMIGRRAAVLRSIAARPHDISDIHPNTFLTLARSRAIDVKNGRCTITRAGLRQLRNME